MRVLNSILCLSIALIVADPTSESAQSDANTDNRVSLTTPRLEYLLGEPVLLDLKFRNHSKMDIKVVKTIIGASRYEAPVWRAREDEPFREFFPQVTDLLITRGVDTLKAGESLDYKYRVVGAPLA